MTHENQNLQNNADNPSNYFLADGDESGQDMFPPVASSERPTRNDPLPVRKYSCVNEVVFGAEPPQNTHPNRSRIESHNYTEEESEIWKAHKESEFHLHAGKVWNTSKYGTIHIYAIIAVIGMLQAVVAYTTNIISSTLIEGKYEIANDIMDVEGIDSTHYIQAFKSFYVHQTLFAALAALFVYIEPACAGSGIPEVKCFLNGIDLPNVTSIKTGICKVLGVCFSISAGLPVGMEGPMVHTGAVLATNLSGHSIRDDKSKRDYISCGVAAGVCTAFSAPIGGILFALEEGCTFWEPSLTIRTFFCSMIAITMMYVLNTIGSDFGKLGFDRLFHFGSFIQEGEATSYSVYELLVFVVIGMMGGLIGACFNSANRKLTLWRIKHVNHSKIRRVVEVVLISTLVTIVSFALPLIWGECTPLPSKSDVSASYATLIDTLVPFGCVKDEEFNQVASLIFTDASTSIRLLFHMDPHSFDPKALLLFFIPYISLATITYGIAVPSGLFVPCLLSGAAFGRLFGDLLMVFGGTNLARSNIYSLIGAASVLGGMARMAISLTVIILESTGNEEYVLPLMISLMTAKLTGGLFTADLYHIHIHMKKGVVFLENKLGSIMTHQKLVAGQVMGENVIFFRPVEKVGMVYDILKSHPHSNYPIVDTGDGDVLFGAIGKNQLLILLEKRVFDRSANGLIEVGSNRQRFTPLVQWEITHRAYPKYPSINDIHINDDDRECDIDLRPYAHTAPYSVQETCSLERAYNAFRTLGCRLLIVVNRYNQCVGTITRKDLAPESLDHHIKDD
mmetsp:Transcript_32800/g.39841  ORF Transcript_32800/g.39841 Transcript_32800/m.39841 type:complete len:791 (-) Transcript_32800:289-2661(-)